MNYSAKIFLTKWHVLKTAVSAWECLDQGEN
jgi:hypothetical protein